MTLTSAEVEFLIEVSSELLKLLEELRLFESLLEDAAGSESHKGASSIVSEFCES